MKKPDFLMKTGPGNEVFDPRQTSHVKKTLKVNIFSRTEYHESAAIFFPFSNLFNNGFLYDKQVKVFMGDGWRLDFHHTHFDTYSPPDFYARVKMMLIRIQKMVNQTNL